MRTATLIETLFRIPEHYPDREMGYQMGSGDLWKWQTYLGI